MIETIREENEEGWLVGFIPGVLASLLAERKQTFLEIKNEKQLEKIRTQALIPTIIAEVSKNRKKKTCEKLSL